MAHTQFTEMMEEIGTKDAEIAQLRRERDDAIQAVMELRAVAAARRSSQSQWLVSSREFLLHDKVEYAMREANRLTTKVGIPFYVYRVKSRLTPQTVEVGAATKVGHGKPAPHRAIRPEHRVSVAPGLMDVTVSYYEHDQPWPECPGGEL